MKVLVPILSCKINGHRYSGFRPIRHPADRDENSHHCLMVVYKKSEKVQYWAVNKPVSFAYNYYYVWRLIRLINKRVGKGNYSSYIVYKTEIRG